jgi:hypothetical protein
VSDHLRAAELMPWLVNKRLEGEELVWITSHLNDCSRCQAVFESERRIYAAVNASDTIEYAPQASFNRLWARIESGQPATAAQPATATEPAHHRGVARAGLVGPGLVGPGLVGPGLVGLAASLLLVIGTGVLLWQWRGAVAPAIAPAQYRTVTSSTTLAPASSINVIFSNAATLADVQLILNTAGLNVLSGPTSAGVFNVGFGGIQRGNDLTASLKSLRNDPRVRFAEPSASAN